MIKSNQRFLNALNALSDGIIILCAYLFSQWFWLDVVKSGGNMAAVSGLNHGAGAAACIYAVVMVILLGIFKLYNSSRIRRIRQEIAAIWGANTLGIISVGAILYLFRLEEFSRGVLFTFLFASSIAVSVKRVGLHYVLNRMRQKGYNQKHVLVAGTGGLARQYIEDVRRVPNFGFTVDGYFGSAENGELNARYMGAFDRLDDYLQDGSVDEVIVALEPEETRHIRAIIGICEKCGTKVSVIPFYNDIIPSNPAIEVIGRSKLINLRSNPLDNLGYAVVKRAFDIFASALLLVALSPLLIAAAIGTRLSSPGPVFFRQQRVGRNKRLFTMYKFRSMRLNDAQDKAWTTDDDPRKTRFGSFLRKCSIDELPQLFNVLIGDMSLVGPRPEIPFYVERFKESVPLYMVKHQVRPGMTGWAQVNGYRGDTSIVRRIEHDIWYIENWSVGLDMRILLMTLLGGWMNHEKVREAEKQNAKEHDAEM